MTDLEIIQLIEKISREKPSRFSIKRRNLYCEPDEGIEWLSFVDLENSNDLIYWKQGHDGDKEIAVIEEVFCGNLLAILLNS